MHMRNKTTITMGKETSVQSAKKKQEKKRNQTTKAKCARKSNGKSRKTKNAIIRYLLFVIIFVCSLRCAALFQANQIDMKWCCCFFFVSTRLVFNAFNLAIVFTTRLSVLKCVLLTPTLTCSSMKTTNYMCLQHILDLIHTHVCK